MSSVSEVDVFVEHDVSSAGEVPILTYNDMVRDEGDNGDREEVVIDVHEDNSDESSLSSKETPLSLSSFLSSCYHVHQSHFPLSLLSPSSLTSCSTNTPLLIA